MQMTCNTLIEQQDLLALFGVILATQENEQQQAAYPALVWHCSWCQPYTDGATSGMCSACRARYYPHITTKSHVNAVRL